MRPFGCRHVCGARFLIQHRDFAEKIARAERADNHFPVGVMFVVNVDFDLPRDNNENGVSHVTLTENDAALFHHSKRRMRADALDLHRSQVGKKRNDVEQEFSGRLRWRALFASQYAENQHLKL